MSKIQLVGHADGSVSVVCAEHPEFQLKLGHSASPSVAFRYANNHYLLRHLPTDGGSPQQVARDKRTSL